MTHTDIIKRFVELRQCRTYLEIGFGDGGNFDQIPVAVKHAVDPGVTGNRDVIPRTSDQFFRGAIAIGTKYDLIFIDGLHTRDQVLRDHDHALKCLNAGGVVLLHDVNPADRSMVGPQHGGRWCGDVYLAWATIRLASPWHTATWPGDCGTGIVDTSRVADRVVFDPPSTFEEFAASRDLILNPITFDDIR